MRSPVQVRKSLLDPRTKLILVLIESVLVLATAGGQRMFWFRLVFAAMPFVLLAVSGRIKPCLIGGVLLGLVEYLDYAVFPSATGILARVLVIVVTIVNRFIPAILMGTYVMHTTKVSEFKAAMDRMHMPDELTIPMCVMFRFFPTLVEEYASISNAMKMRGIRLGGRKPGKILEYRIVPMLTCSARIGEEISASVLTRGLGKSRKRTNICKIGFGVWDIIIFLIVAVTFIYWLMGVVK